MDKSNEKPEQKEQDDQKTVKQYEDAKGSLQNKLDDIFGADMTDQEYADRRGLMPDQEVEDNIEYLKNHPLFWTEPPENPEENPYCQALSQMVYDQDPEDLVKFLNKKGNELYKKGENVLYFKKEAMKAYTEGIDLYSKDKETNAKLFCNRALIQMKFKNFGRAIEDCRQAILQNKKFVKSYFRAAQASLKIHKYKQGLDLITEGLKLDPTNNEFKNIQAECQGLYDKQILKEESLKEKNLLVENDLYQFCKTKEIYLGDQIMDIPGGCKQIKLESNNTLSIPLLVSYPEFQRMDYIERTHLEDKLDIQISQLFKDGFIPYDETKTYTIDNIEIYIEFNTIKPYYSMENQQKWPQMKGWFKANPKCTILELLSTPGFVCNMTPEVMVVCPKSEFYKMFQQHFDVIKNVRL